jgi:hypothetical protein
MSSTSIFTKAVLAMSIAIAYLPLTVHAGTFGEPAPLDPQIADRDEVNATAAVDDAGNATTLWFDGAWRVSYHPRNGVWSAPASFPAAGDARYALLHVSASGALTAVSFTPVGDYPYTQTIYAQDRPSGGVWSAPVMIATGVLFEPDSLAKQFVENSSGDMAVVVAAADGILAVRKSAGGAWGSPELVSPRGVLLSASLGERGDLMVTWDSYTQRCVHRCHDGDYILHTSREVTPAAGWVDSGPLSAPSGGVYEAFPAIDQAGGGVVVGESLRRFHAVSAWTQRHAGEPWKGPSKAFAKGFRVWGVGAGNFGRSTMVVQSNEPAPALMAVDGVLGGDSWGKGHDLNGADVMEPGSLALDFSRRGGVVVDWVTTDASIRAAYRFSANHKWSAPQTVQTGLACSCAAVLSSAIGGNGAAVLLFVRQDGSQQTETLYASTN